jgi:hypothetical protein
MNSLHGAGDLAVSKTASNWHSPNLEPYSKLQTMSFEKNKGACDFRIVSRRLAQSKKVVPTPGKVSSARETFPKIIET